VPRDAEAWLAERGIQRDPIRVDPSLPDTPASAPASKPDAPGGTGGGDPTGTPGDSRNATPQLGDAEVTGREAARLAQQAAADAALADAERASQADPSARHLEDDVAAAVAYVRRSTASAPQSEGRLRDKLQSRGWPGAVIDRTLERARREGLVDDGAMAAALVEERRAKGHASARIRRDLRARGFGDDVLDPLLASAEAEDPEAAAFALARDKAVTLTGVATETAFRRVAAFVARRGYPEGIARKVAREAVFASRDAERAAGH
jgi:regulatory protein